MRQIHQLLYRIAGAGRRCDRVCGCAPTGAGAEYQRTYRQRPSYQVSGSSVPMLGGHCL